MCYVSTCRYLDMKEIVCTNILFIHILLTFNVVNLTKINLCILGAHREFDWNNYMMVHMMGALHQELQILKYERYYVYTYYFC